MTATILGLLPGASVLPYFRRLHVLRRWLIVIVNSDALLAELLDLLPRRSARQAAFNVRSSIAIRRSFWVDRITGGGSSMNARLACKGLRRLLSNLEVLLDDVEDDVFTNIVDAHEVAHLLFSCDAPHALPHHKDTGEMALVVLGPLVPDWLAGVEETSHGRADGADTTEERESRHGRNEPSPKPRYGTYVFLPYFSTQPQP